MNGGDNLEFIEVLDTYSVAFGASLAFTCVFVFGLVEILFELLYWYLRKLKKRTGGSFRESYDDNKDGD